jgi:hypothetical protein
VDDAVAEADDFAEVGNFVSNVRAHVSSLTNASPIISSLRSTAACSMSSDRKPAKSLPAVKASIERQALRTSTRRCFVSLVINGFACLFNFGAKVRIANNALGQQVDLAAEKMFE